MSWFFNPDGDRTDKQSLSEPVTILPTATASATMEPNNVQDEERDEPCLSVKRKRQSNQNNSRDGRKRSRDGNTSTLRTFDDESNSDSEDDSAPDENLTAPSFNGRRIAPNNEKNSNTAIRIEKNLLQDLHLHQSKVESRYLQPLNFSIQRQHELLKEVLEGQKKIIRGLRRRAVSNHNSLHCVFDCMF